MIDRSGAARRPRTSGCLALSIVVHGVTRSRSHETPPVHRASLRRGGNVAAYRARTARRGAAHRRADGLGRGRSGSTTPPRRVFQGLQQLGWTVGQNIRVDCRWAGANADNMRKYATELLALTPNVILAHSSVAIAPLLQVTRAVPIVFAIAADPVGALVFGWIYAAHFLSVGLMALATAETRDLMATYLCRPSLRRACFA
jgi:hypothetical protein